MLLKNRIQKNIDMTQGNISSLLISFALPLIMGDIFQQLYNLTDTWVIGNFASNNEYAAVGSTTFIINMVIKSFIGLSSGAGIIISKYFGSGDREMVRKGSQTAIVIALASSVIFTVLGLVITPFALRMTKAPTEVYNYAKQYLTIVFSFASAQVIYNMGAGVLRAVGDSQKPFLYLVIAAFINVVLDLYFVVALHLGIRGVAYATVIAQCVAAILVVAELLRTELDVKLCVNEWLYDKKLCRDMVLLGLPTGLQMCITSLSNNFIQSYINDLGVNFMSGFATYHKVEELLFTSSNSFGIAAMTFVSQNLGSGNIERAKKGVVKSFIIAVSYVGAFCMVFYAFAPSIVAFFNSDPEVVTYGIMLIRMISPFLLSCAGANILMSSMRGAGNSKLPFAVHIFSNVVFRLIYLFFMTRFVANTPIIVASVYPAGWIINILLMLIAYRRMDYSKSPMLGGSEHA